MYVAYEEVYWKVKIKFTEVNSKRKSIKEQSIKMQVKRNSLQIKIIQWQKMMWLTRRTTSKPSLYRITSRRASRAFRRQSIFTLQKQFRVRTIVSSSSFVKRVGARRESRKYRILMVQRTLIKRRRLSKLSQKK